MAKIVLEVPENLKALEVPLNALVAEAVRRLSDAEKGHLVDYELFERRLRARSADIELAVHGVTLAALDIDADRVVINDIEHVRVGMYPAPFRTQTGEVAVERGLFRPVGERNAETVDLVAMRAGTVGDEPWRSSFSRGLLGRRRRRRNSLGGFRTLDRALSASGTSSETFSDRSVSTWRRHSSEPTWCPRTSQGSACPPTA